MNPFHLAIPVRDVDEARQFYIEILECQPGRSDTTWVDLNFFGHQLVCHQSSAHAYDCERPVLQNPVDGHKVPVPHFGIILAMKDWVTMSEKLSVKHVEFIIEPHIRFKGLPGEQGTMFFLDPSGNAIEIKGFTDIDTQLFSS